MSDLISRQDVIGVIDNAEKIYVNNLPPMIYAHVLEKAIMTIPTQPDLDEVYAHAETEAEARYHAERKKGKWIEQEDSWDGVYYECSACGEPWTTIDGTPWDNGMNFCPHCGADMREPEDIPMEYFESGGR